MQNLSTAPDVSSFPKKLFYRINEVAEIVGVEAYVLRYWESKFRMLKPERIGNDERRYRVKDVELLRTIHHLLYTEKFTIAGAEEKLNRPKSARLAKTKETEFVPPQSDIFEPEEEPEVVYDNIENDFTGLRSTLTLIRQELIDLRESLS